MKTSALVLVALVSAGCKKQPRTTFPAARSQPPITAPAVESASLTSVAPPARSDALQGKVTDKLEVSQYTYLELDGQTWAAVPKASVAVGDMVAVVGASWMENFHSETLNRTWPRIAFGALDTSAQPAHGRMAASGTAEASAPHPAATPAADIGEIRVPKAGQRIADLYAKKTQLAGKSVKVRGKVVKVTNGVLGKNWVHLRDGTGEGPTADLAVATDDSVAVGQTVVVAGTVHLDRDLGAGYHYDVIVEDAKVTAE
jgi:hypothetical protein